MPEATGFETNPTLLLRLRGYPIDEQAWQQFVDRYGEMIFGWCRRWGLQTVDAQDVTQNILLKLVRALQTFDYDTGKSFRSWLKTLTHHAWHDLLVARKAVAAGGGEADTTLGSIPARDDLVAQMEAAYDREIAEHAMARVRLRVAPQTWESFRLTAIEKVPAAEVAERLGIRVMTVYKARSNVQKLLQDEIESATESPRG
jgi:RNA polymerase sigma-70 factor (ECF subfamily)